jgi:hypothetical protein
MDTYAPEATVTPPRDYASAYTTELVDQWQMANDLIQVYVNQQKALIIKIRAQIDVS